MNPETRRQSAKPKKKTGRRNPTPGENPEIPSRAAIERVHGLYLRNDPDIMNAIEETIRQNGYRTVPEAIRHLLQVGISATPVDGEFRAAMRSVRSQMLQFFTTKYWHMLKEMMASFEADWIKINGHEFVAREIARARGEIPPVCPACGHGG